MTAKWSKERAWAWYHARSWIRGCNFMGSDCANRIDQWQAYDFDKHLETAKRELALAAETGFNSIRIIPEYYVWEQEHDGFMERFDCYIKVASQNGISCMVVLGNDCVPPKEEAMRRMRLGEQHVDWGYHGGRKVSQHGTFDGAGYSLFDEPEYADRFCDYVRELVQTYRSDARVLMWDVFNEPGNSKRVSMSLPLMKRMFTLLRQLDPIQPLTVGVWRGVYERENMTEIERYGFDNSDIVSYHNYGTYLQNIEAIRKLKSYGRPILNTEWLNRCGGNTVEAMFPLFYLEEIGCYNWGLVAGKYQTFEPWNNVWDGYRKNPEAYANFDFTKWFHDLYRPSLNPYDPRETELIQMLCARADANFARTQAQP